MGLLDKKIDCKSYQHCISCITYQQQLRRIAIINSLNTKLDTSKITPNCEWFIENVLNGDKKNTQYINDEILTVDTKEMRTSIK